MGENEPVTEISYILVMIAFLFPVFAIMTAVVGIFYLWPDDPPIKLYDALHFTNGGTDTKAVLIDGTLATDGKFKNDAKASPSPDTTASSLIFDNYNIHVKVDTDYTNGSGSNDSLFHPGAAIVFSDNSPPLTVVDADWKDDATTINVTLPPLIQIDIKIWFVNAGNLSLNELQTRADAAVAKANMIYEKERQGLMIEARFEYKTTHLRAHEFSAFTCSLADSNIAPNNIQTVIGHQSDIINVYYVAAVDRNYGPPGILPTNGIWCDGVGAFDTIAIGIEAGDDLLVHELGHAFSLGHVGDPTWASDFDKYNVMHEDPDCSLVNGKWECGRKYLTEGQTYRQVVNTRLDQYTPGSALNNQHIYNLTPPFTPPTPPSIFCKHFRQGELAIGSPSPPDKWVKQQLKSKCPVVEKRIWADGSMMPN